MTERLKATVPLAISVGILAVLLARGLAEFQFSLTAGAGAFNGVLPTPLAWVFISSAVSLLVGPLLGLASVKLASILTLAKPHPASVPVES